MGTGEMGQRESALPRVIAGNSHSKLKTSSALLHLAPRLSFTKKLGLKPRPSRTAFLNWSIGGSVLDLFMSDMAT